MNRFLIEDLPAKEVAELEAHVEWCRTCQQTLDMLTLDPVFRRQALGDITAPLVAQAISLTEPKTAPPNWQAAVPLAQLAIRTNRSAAANLSPPLGPGEIGRIAGYRVLKVLGEGGMGIVFQAEDIQLGRPIALKVMRPETAAEPDAKLRFLHEARACAAVKNDHVITIYHVGEERGVPFMAMELLEGMALEQWLESGRSLTLPQILRVARETAKGLAAAHAKGLVHRDIKPANLWLDQDTGRVLILDFGLARPQREDAHLTQKGYVLGTPSYMAPEQARGEAVDERCDLFSLGVVLYRLCTGRKPFRGETTLAVLTSLAVDQPLSVNQCTPTVPAELSNLIDRLLEKQPDSRPPSAQAVVEAIQAMEGRTPTADRNARLQRQARLIGLTSALLAGALLAAVIIIIRNRDGSETRIEIPDGAGVEVLKDGKRIAQVGPNKEPVAKHDPSPANQLAVIKWLMEEKGLKQIEVEKDGQLLKATTVPALPFKLRGLNLHLTFAARLTTEELQRLNILVDIEGLALYGQPLTDEALAALAPLVELRRLDLCATRLTPAAIETLRHFPKLEELRGMFDSEEWLKGLAQLPELRRLELFRANLSPESLRWIKAFPKLNQLDLASANVSEAALLQLKEAKQLRLLTNLSPRVPKETVDKLATAMPWCEIHHGGERQNPVIYNKGKADNLNGKK